MATLLIKNIYSIRRFLRLTQKEFGQVLGFSESIVSRIEAGKLDPSSNFIDAIRRQFGVNVNDIYGVDFMREALNVPAGVHKKED